MEKNINHDKVEEITISMKEEIDKLVSNCTSELENAKVKKQEIIRGVSNQKYQSVFFDIGELFLHLDNVIGIAKHQKEKLGNLAEEYRNEIFSR